jgi:hypothetical protein
MFGAKACVVTLLAVLPAAVAIAFTVRFAATRNGASYFCAEVVGAELSTV